MYEQLNCENAHCRDSCCPCGKHFGEPLVPENAVLDDEISQEVRLDGWREGWEREKVAGEREEERKTRRCRRLRERYIKAISGPDVCGALVTVPTPLIMFRKVVRRKKMKKAQAHRQWRDEERKREREKERERHQRFPRARLRKECQRRSNSIHGGSLFKVNSFNAGLFVKSWRLIHLITRLISRPVPPLTRQINRRNCVRRRWRKRENGSASLTREKSVSPEPPHKSKLSACVGAISISRLSS